MIEIFIFKHTLDSAGHYCVHAITKDKSLIVYPEQYIMFMRPHNCAMEAIADIVDDFKQEIVVYVTKDMLENIMVSYTFEEGSTIKFKTHYQVDEFPEYVKKHYLEYNWDKR